MTNIINEAILTPPTFCGTDEQIFLSMDTFNQVFNSINGISSKKYSSILSGYVNLPIDNQKAILASCLSYIGSKIKELSVATYPEQNIDPSTLCTTQRVSSYDTPNKISVTNEAKIENPIVKRMRELSGIPHDANRV